jgi:hypothetical protein
MLIKIMKNFEFNIKHLELIFCPLSSISSPIIKDSASFRAMP